MKGGGHKIQQACRDCPIKSFIVREIPPPTLAPILSYPIRSFYFFFSSTFFSLSLSISFFLFHIFLILIFRSSLSSSLSSPKTYPPHLSRFLSAPSNSALLSLHSLGIPINTWPPPRKQQQQQHPPWMRSSTATFSHPVHIELMCRI